MKRGAGMRRIADVLLVAPLLCVLVSAAEEHPLQRFDARFGSVEETLAATQEELAATRRDLAATRRDVAALIDEVNSLRGLVQDGRHPLPSEAAAAARESVEVETDGAQRPPENGSRRLTSSGSTYLALDQYILVHEFPAGHTCPNTAAGATSYRKLLPLDANNAVVWGPSPEVPAATLSLNAVSDDWSTSEIQRFPAPLKVVHPSDCSSDPTLNVQLAATFSTLTVNSIDVGAALSTNWVSFTADSGYWTDMQYMVRNGVVYLKGSATTANTGQFNENSRIGISILPAGARPSANFRAILGGNSNNNGVSYVHVEVAMSGEFWVQRNGGGSGEIYFGGVSFAV